MLTVVDLTRLMEESGRHFTPRTARSWWSAGVLPAPQHGKGLGRGAGTTAGFWLDERVFLQARIAHDLLGRRVSLDRTAAGLWLLGFPVPFDVVRRGIQDQVFGYFRRLGLNAGVDLEDHIKLEDKISDVSERIRRSDARLRRGSSEAQEGEALQWLTSDLLTVLFGLLGEGPKSRDEEPWSKEMADGVATNVQILASIPGRLELPWELPVVKPEDIEDFIVWVSEVASVSRQREAVEGASQHDWVRARRTVLLAVGLLKRADAAIPRETERVLPPSFARLAAAWSCLLFPVLLAITLDAKRHHRLATKLFELGATVRAGPQLRASTKNRRSASKPGAAKESRRTKSR